MTDDPLDKKLEADVALTKARANLANMAAWFAFWLPGLVVGVTLWVTR